MKIAFCASEAYPFVKTGGLADVCHALPAALKKLGIEVSLFLPFYQDIDKDKFSLTKAGPGIYRSRFEENVDVYFIEQKAFFNRPGLYGDGQRDYADNLERFQYFSSRTLEALKELKLTVDVIHGHDWHAALIPVYLKEKLRNDAFYAKTKSVLTIHNLAYQGIFPKEKYPKLGLRPELFGMKHFEFFGQINLLKAGLVFADLVTTVSPRYAGEIQTKEFGSGLDGVLRSLPKKPIGILNGISQARWDPAADSLIHQTYSASDYLQGKKENKLALQRAFGLPENENIPLFGFVARLTQQKGVDLILAAAAQLEKKNIQIVLQGVGEKKYYELLRNLAKRYPQKAGVHLDFNEQMAHQIYAGSDFFLIPSAFEPCGLSQMISMRYGTIPIGFKTGGLADTIIPFDVDSRGNGFLFKEYTTEDFLKTIQNAIEVYKKKQKLRGLIENAFRSDFSWDASAQKYAEVYNSLCL